MRTLWVGGIEFLIAMPLAGAVAAFCALIVGVPTLRLRGVCFSIGTLALAASGISIFLQDSPVRH